MEWIKEEHDFMRGEIEPRVTFIGRNTKWWWVNRKPERMRRKKYYDTFLEYGNVLSHIKPEMTIGEVGPGPFGGIIEVCKIPAKKKVFIDYIMEELYKLHFIEWPDNSLMVDAPAENIPLPDDSIDVLLSFNCLDHGWDTLAAIKESVRISKCAFLAFDCRGDDNGEVAIRQDGKDKDHHQLLTYDYVHGFMDTEINKIANWKMSDMKLKHFPVVFIHTEK
jgi:SAM-dependent methyltransferase